MGLTNTFAVDVRVTWEVEASTPQNAMDDVREEMKWVLEEAESRGAEPEFFIVSATQVTSYA